MTKIFFWPKFFFDQIFFLRIQIFTNVVIFNNISFTPLRFDSSGVWLLWGMTPLGFYYYPLCCLTNQGFDSSGDFPSRVFILWFLYLPGFVFFGVWLLYCLSLQGFFFQGLSMYHIFNQLNLSCRWPWNQLNLSHFFPIPFHPVPGRMINLLFHFRSS